MCAHEAIELVPQSIVACAGLGEESRPLFRGAGDGRLEQLVEALPAGDPSR